MLLSNLNRYCRKNNWTVYSRVLLFLSPKPISALVLIAAWTSQGTVKHIEAWTKWPIFCRSHFIIFFFMNENVSISNSALLKYILLGPIYNLSALVHVMDLRFNSHQAISWCKAQLDLWRQMATLSHNELIYPGITNTLGDLNFVRARPETPIKTRLV